MIRGTLPEDKAGTVLVFPVVQECGTAANRWVEVPAVGQDPHDLEFPAPTLKLAPAEHHGH